MKEYRLTFLGTGTSTGVPSIGCDCRTCSSLDPRDKRLRASVILTLPSGRNLLIDCGPDFRTQILRIGSPDLEAALITHSHYDHVGGIDDLRPYCADGRNFPLYCQADVEKDLRERNPWSFAENPYPGVPTFDIHTVEPFAPFKIAGQKIIPIPVMHGELPILGYRIGPIAYITDCKTISTEAIKALEGLDTLVINALRLLPHQSHMNLNTALNIIRKINPQKAYLTHMSHDMPPHAQVVLPPGVWLAHDGQTVTVPA
ncbi:MAG: MBL fold metallo-hydrolase [Muribaculaceae bacterium]|nr:MBL fold metallo-hydrolase [Muribaculaceae bacterium]